MLPTASAATLQATTIAVQSHLSGRWYMYARADCIVYDRLHRCSQQPHMYHRPALSQHVAEVTPCAWLRGAIQAPHRRSATDSSRRPNATRRPGRADAYRRPRRRRRARRLTAAEPRYARCVGSRAHRARAQSRHRPTEDPIRCAKSALMSQVPRLK